MKLLNVVDFQTLTIVDLPRNCYRVRIASNPAKLKIIFDITLIVTVSILFAVFS